MTLSEFQALWNKEVKRVQKLIAKYTEKGFNIDYTMPKQPKGIAPKQLEDFRHESTKEKILYLHSTYTAPDSDTTVSGYQGVQLQRRQSAKKGQATKRKKQAENKETIKQEIITYDNLLAFFRRFTAQPVSWVGTTKTHRRSDSYAETLLAKQDRSVELTGLLEYVRERDGRALFQRLQDNAMELQFLMSDFELASRQNDVNTCATEFATIINGESLDDETAVMMQEAYENMEAFDLV